MPKLCALFGVKFVFKKKKFGPLISYFRITCYHFHHKAKAPPLKRKKKSDQTQGHADDRYTGEQLYLILKFSFIRKQ